MILERMVLATVLPCLIFKSIVCENLLREVFLWANNVAGLDACKPSIGEFVGCDKAACKV